MQISKHWLTHFFDNRESQDVDYNRRHYSFLAYSSLGFLVLAVMSYRSYHSGHMEICLITLITSLVFFLNLTFYHLFKRLDLCGKVGSICIVCFCLTLVYWGGIDNTALYWAFSFPLVLFAVHGYFFGLIANSILFISLLIMLTNSELLLAHYKNSEVIRFLSSYFIINIISFINEYYREHSHEILSDINISRDQQANTDALTNLPNRRFVDSIFFPTSKANVNDKFPMVLIMADVDKFKSFNDTYGHHIGDLILERLARSMEQCIRNEDIVARVGGEEFLLLFSSTSYEKGLKIAEKIRKEVSLIEIEHDQQVLQITMSFGVSIASNHSEIESKLKEADTKLYQAKNTGRNCVF
jgi:diguanylate cyclase (GGDEF)-like protein